MLIQDEKGYKTVVIINIEYYGNVLYFIKQINQRSISVKRDEK